MGTITACDTAKEVNTSNLDESIYDAVQQGTEVILSVKEEKITQETETITLLYTNHSDQEYIYGAETHLEVKVDDKWYVVPLLEDVGWEDIAYILSPNDTREDTFYIKANYGQLDGGNYRIVKTLHADNGSIFSIAEFKIQ